MTSMPQRVDFDTRPPMPVNEYAGTVNAVNVGYDLVFTLSHCFLRALHQPDLRLLVVGAGGGQELERFLPGNPGWRIVGVDPSQDMLALAQATVERLGVQDRVELVRGTVEELPAEQRFDAATCFFVLHFLPDAAKLSLLRGIAARLRPHAPLLAVSGARVDAGGLREDFLGAWQQHGELMGLPAERMAAIIEQLLAQQEGAASEEDYVRLLHDAGFQKVAPFLSIMNGSLGGWIARR